MLTDHPGMNKNGVEIGVKPQTNNSRLNIFYLNSDSVETVKIRLDILVPCHSADYF